MFREDLQRTKTANAPDNLATIRKLALQMIRKIDDNQSIKNTRKRAGWDDDALCNILAKIKYV